MKFISRIVPVVLFSILSLPLYILCVKNAGIKHLLLQAAYLSFGIPMFNFVTWFLIGRNTLILMGLNGMLLYINKYLVMFGITYISDSMISIFALTAFLTIISIVICIPIALLLKKYLPQFIGAPT
jgi:hypothetical protein